MGLVDEVFERKRREAGKTAGTAPVVRADHDHAFGIDLANRPGRVILDRKIIVRHFTTLHRLVEEVVPHHDRVRLETAGDFPPGVQISPVVFLHAERPVGGGIAVGGDRLLAGGAERAGVIDASTRQQVHVDDDMNAVPLKGGQQFFQPVQLTVDQVVVNFEVDCLFVASFQLPADVGRAP